MWQGARHGRVVTHALRAPLWPATREMRVVARASARAVAVRMVVSRRASMDLPAPGGPMRRTWWAERPHSVHSWIRPASSGASRPSPRMSRGTGATPVVPSPWAPASSGRLSPPWVTVVGARRSSGWRAPTGAHGAVPRRPVRGRFRRPDRPAIAAVELRVQQGPTQEDQPGIVVEPRGRPGGGLLYAAYGPPHVLLEQPGG